MTDTYIYDNTEVILTGRIAVKENKRTSRSGTSKNGPILNELVEIKPVNSFDGGWTKFVKIDEMYKVLKNHPI